MVPRLGVLKPERSLDVVAAAEARVIRNELERRLGPITLDLRIVGDPLAEWQSFGQASWPTDVDAVIDAGLLWRPDLPPLTALFGRTLDSGAAAVRRRMLRHLGLVPDAPFDLDGDRLDRLTEFPLRPTDLWLIADAARSVTHPDPAIGSFAAQPGSDEHVQLDAAFELVVEVLGDIGRRDDTIVRLSAQIDGLTGELSELRSELARSEREALVRLDQLAAVNTALRERLERAELARSIDIASS